MLAANGLKMIGCLLMLASVNPLLAHAVVGLGAAAYSPAKYGIVIELLPATMGLVYRWHRSNRVRQRDEVDQLLAVAHSGPHGSGRHRRIERAAERRYARRMKTALNGACRSAINPIRRTPRRSCDSCAEYLTAVKRARRSRRLKCAPHAADFRPPCRSISNPVWRQP